MISKMFIRIIRFYQRLPISSHIYCRYTPTCSEYMIGWTTKFGDSACDFNPIQHLTCTEVIQIGRELARSFKLPIGYIVKKPSDGLTGKTDEDNFGFTYAELDDYLLNGTKGKNIEKIKNMIKWSGHKKTMPASLINNKE